MLRQLSLLLVLCGGLAGCQAAPSFAKWSGHSERYKCDKRPLINDLSMDDLRYMEEELFLKAAAGSHGNSIKSDDLDEQSNPIGVDFDFNVNDTIDTSGQRQRFGRLASHEDPFLREQIVAAARGSQIGVHDKSGGRYCGTVLRAGPDRIEMMNCLSQEVIPGPDGQLQCKKSHIPFLTIETSAVIHFVTIAPPPPNFPKTDEEIDPSDYSVAEIVNRSGQRLSWGKAPEAGDVGVASVKSVSE